MNKLSFILLGSLIAFILRVTFDDQLKNISPWLNSFLRVILLLLMFFVFIVMTWKGYRFKNEYRCPQCHAGICNYPLASAVIATGKCGKCGKQIFSDTSVEKDNFADLGS